MSGPSKIQWTDNVWNPVRGCSRVSDGCRHCYAERIAARFSGPGQPYEGLASWRLRCIDDDNQRNEGRWTGKVALIAGQLSQPMRWRRPRRIFVNSMSDLFHEGLTNEQIAAVFAAMAAAPQHRFQVLTKRARRMRDWFDWVMGSGDIGETLAAALEVSESGEPRFGDEDWLCGLANVVNGASAWKGRGEWHTDQGPNWPLPHVWLGVSAENQETADERIPELLETPAAVRFVSAEPLLGPLDLSEYLDPCGAPCGESNETLDWVIAGCESGPGAREAEVEWYRSLRDQCRDAPGGPTAFFLKQAINEHYYGSTHQRGAVLDADGACDVGIAPGPGSQRKAAGGHELVGAPYLDGAQYLEMPK
jgi:protein gp37